MFLNNNTSLKLPALYIGSSLRIQGDMIAHHFHKHETGVIIEFELDTPEWSSVFVKFDNSVLKLLVPLLHQSKHTLTEWTEVGSRKWRISSEEYSSVYTEDEIAKMLWRKMHRVSSWDDTKRNRVTFLKAIYVLT